jgi:Ion transport protein
MFLTPSQKSYYCAMKKLGRKKPQKVIKRPFNQALAMFYDLANSRRFEIAIFVLIFLNMLSMGIEHFGQPDVVFFLLEVSNAFFTTVFGLECIVKIIGEEAARLMDFVINLDRFQACDIITSQCRGTCSTSCSSLPPSLAY